MRHLSVLHFVSDCPASARQMARPGACTPSTCRLRRTIRSCYTVAVGRFQRPIRVAGQKAGAADFRAKRAAPNLFDLLHPKRRLKPRKTHHTVHCSLDSCVPRASKKALNGPAPPAAVPRACRVSLATERHRGGETRGTAQTGVCLGRRTACSPLVRDVMNARRKAGSVKAKAGAD